VLHCHGDIELNPFHARIMDTPTAFPWSSCTGHCGLRQEATLSPRRKNTMLSAAPETRRNLQQLLREVLSNDDLKAIRTNFQQ